MRHSRAISGLALGAAAAGAPALLAGCSSSGTRPPARTGLVGEPPASVMSQALAAAQASGSAHVTMTDRSGSSSIVFNDDSSSRAGRQVITTSSGGRMIVLVVGGVAYARGNAEALALFGMSSDDAVRLSGRWISYRPGQPGYQDTVEDVTLGSVIDFTRLAGRLTPAGTATIDGQPVIGVRGAPPASAGFKSGTLATLYVATTGRRLPVSLQEGTRNQGESDVFSRWGERVRVSAPRDAIPISSALQAGAPPGTD
jgi:hypothetical protein